MRGMPPHASATAEEPISQRETALRLAPIRRRRGFSSDRRRNAVAVSLGIALVLITLTGAGVIIAAPQQKNHASQQAKVDAVSGKAAAAAANLSAATPSHTPTTPSHASSTPAPLIIHGTAAGEFCHDTVQFVANISQWTVPPGCYGTIYTPNQAQYPYRIGFGYCNWWVREQHLNHVDITENTSYPRGSTPAVGAAVFFAPNVQGASSAGHWAQVVAISPDHTWLLISEMNFGWRGGGFGKVDYRYVQPGPGLTFIYA